jgi:hypothetical protein
MQALYVIRLMKCPSNEKDFMNGVLDGLSRNMRMTEGVRKSASESATGVPA